MRNNMAFRNYRPSVRLSNSSVIRWLMCKYIEVELYIQPGVGFRPSLLVYFRLVLRLCQISISRPISVLQVYINHAL